MTDPFRELVRVYVTDKELHEWLKSQPEMSAFIVQTLQDLKDGELVYLADSIDAKIKEAKLENLGYKNRIDKVRALHIETFGTEPSPQATNAIHQAAATPTILQADGSLKCVTCGKSFPKEAYDFMQGDHYSSHVKHEHGRQLYAMEKTVVAKLVGIDEQ